MDGTYECPECHKYSITVMTRTQYFRNGDRRIKERSCLPCWRDLMTFAEAHAAMDGEGA